MLPRAASRIAGRPRVPPGPGWLILALFLIAAAPGAGRAADGGSTPLSVGKLEMVGMPDELAAKARKGLVLSVKTGFLKLKRPLFAAKLLEDDADRLRLFLARNGYPDAQVTSEIGRADEDGKVHVLFRVEPGTRVVFADVETVGVPEGLGDEAAKVLADIAPGRPFADELVQMAVPDLVLMLKEAGYAFPEVTVAVTRRGRDRANVKFVVVPGERFRIGEITVQGAPPDLEGLARRSLDIAPGDPFSHRAMEVARENLRSTGLFRQMRVSVDPADSGTADLLAAVQARKMKTLSLGVGTWTDNPIRLYALLMHRNLLTHGWGGSLEGSYATYENYLTAQIWATSLVRVRSRTTLHGTYETEDEAAYYLKNREVGLSNLFNTLGNISWRVGLTYSDVDVDQRSEDIEELPYDEGRQLTLEGRWYRDGADNPLSPSTGTRLTLVGAWAPSWSVVDLNITDSPFWSLRGTLVRYFELVAGKSVLALRGDVGYGKPLEPSQDLLPNRSFFAGGFNTMRGYKRRELGPVDSNNNPIGGQVRILASAELRQDLWKFIGLVAFLDTGQVWSTPQQVTFGDYQYALGGGPSFSTPIGPLSVVYAQNLATVPPGRGQYVWHFGIGNSF